MPNPLRVLYDGWPLVHTPAGPGAFHLLAMLHALPPEVVPVVACPGAPPAWFESEFEAGTAVEIRVSEARDRLAWEQRRINELASDAEADLIHLTAARAPINSHIPIVVSPSEGALAGRNVKGLRRRLGDALAKGGIARAALVLWPDDLPTDGLSAAVHAIPPVTHPAFSGPGSAADLPIDAGLPETYILFHGPLSERVVDVLLSAWTWAASPIGQLYPLVLAGCSSDQETAIAAAVQQLGLDDTVQILPALSPAALAAAYRGSTAIFHPAPVSPWGSAVRRGLASGKALVLTESPLADATVGPAAFVLPSSDTRRLGAALITTVVEDEVREKLEGASRKRSAGWHSELFAKALLKAYRSVVRE